MGKALNKAWTSEDDERLRELVTRGDSAVRVALALKRSRRGVYNRARKLGCPIQTPLEKAGMP